MKRLSIWDITIITGVSLILIWATLKSIGIINSPTWVEMIPYFGISLSIIGGAYNLGKIKRGIDETQKKVDKLLDLESRFYKLENEHVLLMQGKLKI